MRDLPSSWLETTLGEACIVAPTGPPLDSRAPFIPMSSVEVGCRHPVSTEPRGNRGGIRARSGDLLFARITPCLENGKVALVPPGLGDVGGSTEFIVVRPREGVSEDFLYYWALHPEIRQFAQSQMTGTTGRMRLSAGDLSRAPFWLAPLDEQQCIVEALDEAFSKLNRGESGLKAGRRRLHRMRVSLLDAATAGHLVPQHDSEASALEYLRTRGREPERPDGELPEGWATVTLDALLDEIETGKSFATKGQPALHGRMGVIKVSAMTWGEFRAGENKALPDHTEIDERWVIRAGDLLVSRANTADYVGACVLVPTDQPNLILSDKSLRLVPAQGVERRWLLHTLRSRPVRDQIARLATGTKDSMRNISQAKLRSLRVRLPPSSEQVRIADELERQLSFLQVLDRSLDAATVRANQLRWSLLTAAFQGQLVNRSKGDAPASASLGLSGVGSLADHRLRTGLLSDRKDEQ